MNRPLVIVILKRMTFLEFDSAITSQIHISLGTKTTKVFRDLLAH